MNFADFEKQYENSTADEIIKQLENKYKDNADALEDIERAKSDIEYIRSQKNYQGQTPKQRALSLAGTLLYWD
jgi:hypothetical protein